MQVPLTESNYRRRMSFPRCPPWVELFVVSVELSTDWFWDQVHYLRPPPPNLNGVEKVNYVTKGFMFENSCNNLLNLNIDQDCNPRLRNLHVGCDVCFTGPVCFTRVCISGELITWYLSHCVTTGFKIPVYTKFGRLICRIQAHLECSALGLEVKD